MRKIKQRNPGAFKKCTQYIRALEEHGLALPYDYVRHIKDDVWELRLEFGGVEYRLFFGSVGGDIFGIVSAYQKTWDRVPDQVWKLTQTRIDEMRRASE